MHSQLDVATPAYVSVIERHRAELLETLETTGDLQRGCPQCQPSYGYEDPRHGIERYGAHPDHAPAREWTPVP